MYNLGMEYIVIGLLIVYAVIKDVLFYKERENLTRKLMSRNLKEYITSIAPEPANGKSEENPYIPVSEASYDQILKAKASV